MKQNMKRRYVKIGLSILGIVWLVAMVVVYMDELRIRRIEEGFYNLITEYEEATPINQIDSEDYPAKQNVGKVKAQNGDKYLFMTDGTSLSYEVELDDKKRAFECEYQLQESAVKWDISDGCNLKISICADGMKPIEQQVRVDPRGKKEDVSVDVSAMAGKKITILLTCDEDSDKTQDADWLKIPNAKITY